MAQMIVRDPVHDVVAFETGHPLDDLLFRLLNADEFQRLRRIRQLGMTSLAYPGADHSRYSHSLGVMETARRVLNQIRREIPLTERQEAVCLSAALLHDLGHGPFSHVFERISGIAHEDVTCGIILSEEAHVHRVLAGFHPDLPGEVANLLRHQPKPTFLSDIISSQLDADRFDYLLRDNLMTGSRYGDYDLTWLLHALTVDVAGDRLAIHAKGVSAVEAYLQSRYHMYRNVYFHKVVRTAEGLVKLVLHRAKLLAVQDRLSWPPPEHALHTALVGRRLPIDQFLDLDDVSVMHCFKVWAKEDDALLARLSRALLYRRLYRVIELPVETSPEEVSAAMQRVREAIIRRGGDGDYEVFYDQPSNAPYDAEGQNSHAREIAVVLENRQVVPLTQISALPEALNRQLAFKRVHVSAEYYDTAMQALPPLLTAAP
jgi:HD superfamily phosphohydrolase